MPIALVQTQPPVQGALTIYAGTANKPNRHKTFYATSETVVPQSTELSKKILRFLYKQNPKSLDTDDLRVFYAFFTPQNPAHNELTYTLHSSPDTTHKVTTFGSRSMLTKIALNTELQETDAITTAKVLRVVNETDKRVFSANSIPEDDLMVEAFLKSKNLASVSLSSSNDPAKGFATYTWTGHRLQDGRVKEKCTIS